MDEHGLPIVGAGVDYTKVALYSWCLQQSILIVLNS